MANLMVTKFKEKYPQYAEVDDLELAQRVVKKYPQYKAMLDELGQGKEALQKTKPSVMQTAMGMAGETAKNLMAPLAGPGYGSKLTIEDPETAALAVGVGLSPAGAIAGELTNRYVKSERGQEQIKKLPSWAQKPVEYGAPVAAGIAGAGAGSAVSRLAKKTARGLSGRLINSMVKPKSADFMFGKNPGQEVARQGIVGNSLDDLANNIGKRIETLTGELSNRVAKSTTKINANKILDVVNESIDELAKFPKVSAPKIKALEALRDDIVGIKRNELGQIVSRKSLTNLSAKAAVQLKRDLGNLVKWTTTLGDDVSSAVAKTIRKVYGSLDKIIDDAVPATKTLNSQISNLISARNATLTRMPVEQRNAIVGLLPRLTGVAGGVAGASASGPMGGLLGYIAGAAAEKALTSPAVRTRAAAALGKYGANAPRIIKALQSIKPNPIQNIAIRGINTNPQINTTSKAVDYLVKTLKIDKKAATKFIAENYGKLRR